MVFFLSFKDFILLLLLSRLFEDSIAKQDDKICHPANLYYCYPEIVFLREISYTEHKKEGESMDYSKNERIYDYPAIFRIDRIPCRRSFDFQGAVLDLAIKNRHTTT